MSDDDDDRAADEPRHAGDAAAAPSRRGPAGCRLARPMPRAAAGLLRRRAGACPSIRAQARSRLDGGAGHAAASRAAG